MSASGEPAQLQKHSLRLGMSVTVDVNLHDQRGPTLAQQSPTQPAFSTDVYRRQLARADAAITQIVRANMARGK